MITGRKVWRIILSPYMILVFGALGWGPQFVADIVWRTRPDLSARYVPQAFGMGWLPITLWCSVLAVAYFAGHILWIVVRFAVQSVGRDRAKATVREE